MFDLIKSSIEKERIQEEASNLATKYDNLLLSWATGTSKTKAIIRIIENYYQSYKTSLSDPNFYILLKETNHEQNWRDEFKKWGKEDLLIHITFFCYASLNKFMHDRVDVLILDECHALSEMREDYLKTIKCDKIISLSATVDNVVKNRIKSYKSGFYEFHISLQEAIDRGIVPEPHIYVAYVDLDDKEKKYEWTSPKAKKAKPTILTAKTYYNRLQKKIDWYEEQFRKGEVWAENRWIQTMGVRKKEMAKLKTDAAKKLLQSLDSKRYICFCGSIEQANEIGEGFVIHSKVDKTSRAARLFAFNEGFQDRIFAVGMLREAMNLNNIEAAVIVQLDNQQGSFEQMTGRALRSLAPEVYLLILRGTKDEDYFDKATRGISSQYISEYIWPKD